MRKYMNVTLYRSARALTRKRVFAPVAALTAVLGCVSSASADVAAMFAAVDLTTFDANITTVLTALLGISLMGAAYVYMKRALPGRF